jgi:hypothetical protein
VGKTRGEGKGTEPDASGGVSVLEHSRVGGHPGPALTPPGPYRK